MWPIFLILCGILINYKNRIFTRRRDTDLSKGIDNCVAKNEIPHTISLHKRTWTKINKYVFFIRIIVTNNST